MVLLPASRARARAESRPAAVEGWRGSGTALVVDDEESVRGPVGAMLKTMGFEVLLAADGREGVEVSGREHARLRLVLLDMTMPRMDGAEAFREMRRIDPRVPVVLCSGCDERTATSRFAGMELAGFVAKPMQFEALTAAARAACEGRRNLGDARPIQSSS